MIFQAKLSSREKLADFRFRCSFAMPSGENLKFDPGQYLMLDVGDIRRRPYSIESSAANGNKFSLLVDTSPQGIGSKLLENMKVGESIEVQGPFGLNILEHGAESYLFIAAGVGISPFMSMLRALFESGFKGEIRLVQGASTITSLLNQKEFSEMQKTFSNFKWLRSISKSISKEDDLKEIFHGRLTEWINQNYLPQPSELVYLCGSPEMVRDCRTTLIQKGINPKKLKIEVFS